MNILDFASNTEEEEVLKTNPQSYQVIGEVVNSAVQGDGPAMNYQPSTNQGTVLQDVIGAEQSQLANEEQQVAQQASDVAQQEQAVQQEEGGVMSFLGGLAKGFSEVMTNPDVLTGLNSFSAAMRGDINSYNAYQNAYAERMENRAQQRAAAAQKQRDNEAANARAMQEQLWKQYTPESVAEFQRTGDYGVLVENQATKMAREAHDTDVAYKKWEMDNKVDEQKRDQSNFETTRSDKKEADLQARLEKRREKQQEQEKIAAASSGNVPAYRQSGTSYQASKVDSKGNITWETITKPEEEALAKRYLGTTEAPALVEQSRQGTDFANSPEGIAASESSTVTGWLPNAIDKAPKPIKVVGEYLLNQFSDEDVRKLRTSDAALEAQLTAAGTKAYTDAGNAKPNSNEEQVIARKLAPTIDYSTPESYKRTRAEAVAYVEKVNKSLGIPAPNTSPSNNSGGKFIEGQLYQQNGKNYRYTNGKFVPEKAKVQPTGFGN